MSNIKKTIFGIGILTAGAFSSILQATFIKDSHKNCDHEGLAQLVDLLEDENTLCARWVDDKCVQCSTRTYFNQKGICIQVDPLCKTFDQKKKRCSNCYPGYQLVQDKCIIVGTKEDQNWALSNPLCSTWSHRKCTRCSSKSYFNSEGICVMVSPDCRTHDEKNGNCLSCFDGYELESGRCNKTNQDWRLKNPLCSQWGAGGVCQKCATRTYRNKEGMCVQVDPNCNNYQNQSGNCLDCFSGYSLKDGKCVIEQKANNEGNPYCARWDRSKCTRCSDRSYLNKSGICTPVSPQCKTYSEQNGDCTACYQGFQLKSGKCSNQPKSNNSVQNNPLCSLWSGNKCSKCAPRSYFQENGICVAIDPYCERFSEEKRICQKCYKGYRLRKDLKGCVAPGQTISTTTVVEVETQVKGYDDPYCSQWENPTLCKKCAPGTYKGVDNRCLIQDTKCKTFNHKQRLCVECFDDFIPIQQKCIAMERIENTFDIQKCMQWRQGICLECASGLELNSTGLCSCK